METNGILLFNNVVRAMVVILLLSIEAALTLESGISINL